MSDIPCYKFDPMDEILFGKNFGMISDMKFGPDGALYVISLMEGKIYRIILGWFFKNRLNDRKKISNEQ